MKVCTKCGQRKPLDAFYFIATRGYYRATCKPCTIKQVGQGAARRTAERDACHAALRRLVVAWDDCTPPADLAEYLRPALDEARSVLGLTRTAL